MKDVINKERRDQILKILEFNSPEAVGENVIHHLINEAGFNVDINVTKKDLFYLQDNKLIEVETVKNEQYGLKRFLCKITAKGIDHLEGAR